MRIRTLCLPLKHTAIMNSETRACVLTAHNEKGWYPKGQERLVRSLNFHGFPHDIAALTCTPHSGGWVVSGTINGQPLEPYHTTTYKSDCVYTLKAAAWEYVSQFYDVILWLDCSVWAIKPIEPIMDIIEHEGYYFWRSGYSLGQTSGRHCLKYFRIDEDESFDIQDTSTSMMGLKLSNPLGADFLKQWLASAKNGMFHGSRDAIVGASGREQLFEHRQDQSAASCLTHKIGLKLTDPGIYSQYANDDGNYPESVRLVMRGM